MINAKEETKGQGNAHCSIKSFQQRANGEERTELKQRKQNKCKI